ncbi:MAG: hypothetical protein V4629_10050 [Pseudomonadota bacterium]
MHNVSIRIQVNGGATTCNKVSDHITSYLKNIKESYASFKDRLLWTETTNIRQSSSITKKQLHPTLSQIALLTKPLTFIRSECSAFKKTSFFKFLKEKLFTQNNEVTNPNFNRSEAIEKEKERRAELHILSAIPVEDLTDNQLQTNK